LPLAFARGRQRSSHFRRQNNSRLGFCLGAQTGFAVPVLSLRSTGIPENAQRALAKIDIRSQIGQILYLKIW
jgi:hypothetical protein